jgi:hypothetical protein
MLAVRTSEVEVPELIQDGLSFPLTAYGPSQTSRQNQAEVSTSLAPG